MFNTICNEAQPMTREGIKAAQAELVARGLKKFTYTGIRWDEGYRENVRESGWLYAKDRQHAMKCLTGILHGVGRVEKLEEAR